MAEPSCAAWSFGEASIAWWIVPAAAVLFAGYWASLAVRLRAAAGVHAECERQLATAIAALRRFADEHGGQLPQALPPEMAETAASVSYRPVPHDRCDQRLLVLHDAGARRRVIEFPVLRPARGVWFLSGRTVVVSEEAFDKLVAADNALRAKLGIDVYDVASTSASTGGQGGGES